MSNLNAENIRTRLARSLPDLDQRILLKELDLLSIQIAEMDGDLLKRLLAVLLAAAEFRLKIYTHFQDLTGSLPKLRSPKERIQRMMQFLQEFVPEKELSQDRKAFDRWMDITGVRERARVAMHESDRLSEMILHLLRDHLIELFADLPESAVLQEWKAKDLSRYLENELVDSPRWQNQVTVLKVWEGLCRSLPENKWRLLWSESWDRRIKDYLSSPEENIWVQVQAFKLCVLIESNHGLAMIHHRLTSPAAGRDDVFLRASLLDVVEKNYHVNELRRLILEIIHRPDPSEYVLIAAIRKIASVEMPDNVAIVNDLLSNTKSTASTDKVRASTAIALETILLSAISAGVPKQIIGELQTVQENALKHATGYRFQLALIESLGKAALTHADRQPGDAIDEFDHRILQNLDQVISSENYVERVRRIASEIRETIILNRHPVARRLYQMIMDRSENTRPGEYFSISSQNISDDAILGRVLAWISVSDYGYYAQPESNGYKIWRGEIFKRRLWRLLHELNHPDPAKRQGYVHTVGRSYPGLIRAHARYLSETTETKVPGERLFFRNEYSWRPFLPTIDDVLSTTQSRNAGKTIYIYSSEGVFSITGPTGFPDRFSIWWYITLNYGNLVQKRNYDLEDIRSGHTRNFTQILSEDFGFNIDFQPHAYTFQDQTFQAIDPHISAHMYPLIRNQLEWRPLS